MYTVCVQIENINCLSSDFLLNYDYPRKKNDTIGRDICHQKWPIVMFE